MTWNLEWASPSSARGGAISAYLSAQHPDVLCLTEAFASNLPAGGHVIEAGSGNKVADRKGAKKVLLWSISPWIDASAHKEISPAGRMVSGTTIIEGAHVRVIGVCIPWAGSGTPRVGGNQRPWADHLAFINQAKEHWQKGSMATVLLGDFNQRLPRQRQPKQIAEALEAALRSFIVATRGFASLDGNQTIDHFAHTHDLSVQSLSEIPKEQGGLRLSDHFGINCLMTTA